VAIHTDEGRIRPDLIIHRTSLPYLSLPPTWTCTMMILRRGASERCACYYDRSDRRQRRIPCVYAQKCLSRILCHIAFLTWFPASGQDSVYSPVRCLTETVESVE